MLGVQMMNELDSKGYGDLNVPGVNRHIPDCGPFRPLEGSKSPKNVRKPLAPAVRASSFPSHTGGRLVSRQVYSKQ